MRKYELSIDTKVVQSYKKKSKNQTIILKIKGEMFVKARQTSVWGYIMQNLEDTNYHNMKICILYLVI